MEFRERVIEFIHLFEGVKDVSEFANPEFLNRGFYMR